MYFDLNYVIEQVGKEKGIPKETLIAALEEAILSASKKKYGSHLDLEAKYNEELGEIEVFQFKKVVEKWMAEWVRYTPQVIDISVGCGIHTGTVLVGNVGTEFRDQFTALGPDVNLASRLCGKAAPGQILLSQSTQTRVKSTLTLTDAGEINDVKNIPGRFQLFAI